MFFDLLKRRNFLMIEYINQRTTEISMNLYSFISTIYQEIQVQFHGMHQRTDRNMIMISDILQFWKFFNVKSGNQHRMLKKNMKAIDNSFDRIKDTQENHHQKTIEGFKIVKDRLTESIYEQRNLLDDRRCSFSKKRERRMEWR
jgi:hypothetical protein